LGKDEKAPSHEVREAAIALRDGKLPPEVYFEKLITLLRDHFQNLGLSDAAFRYWVYEDSPELWRTVKAEFSKPGVNDGLLKGRAMGERPRPPRLMRLSFVSPTRLRRKAVR